MNLYVQQRLLFTTVQLEHSGQSLTLDRVLVILNSKLEAKFNKVFNYTESQFCERVYFKTMNFVERKNKSVKNLSGVEARCNLCGKTESETLPLQYAHIIPKKLVGQCVRDENGFALCGNNGGDNKCHAVFDKKMKPILRKLARDSEKAESWLEGRINLFDVPEYRNFEKLLRVKIRKLIHFRHPNSFNWCTLVVNNCADLMLLLTN